MAKYPNNWNIYYGPWDLYPFGTLAFLYGGTSAHQDAITTSGISANNYANSAINNGDFGEWAISSTIPLNGMLTTDISGTLIGYFKLYWQGTITAPAYPDHITLLLQTKLNAQVSQNYSSPLATFSNLVAYAIASDSFNETVKASIWTPNQGTVAPPPVIGMHLVQAPVDPNTGIATVSVSGTSHQVVSNTVPLHTAPDSSGNLQFNVATANTEADVFAGARPDTRAVTISSTSDITNMKSPVLNVDDSVKVDAYQNIIYQPAPHVSLPDGTMYADIGIGYGLNSTSTPEYNLYSVIFSPHLAGNWGSNLTYYWFSSLKNSGAGGITFGNTYIDPVPPYSSDGTPPIIDAGETGKTDHLHLTLTDNSDGAQATANY